MVSAVANIEPVSGNFAEIEAWQDEQSWERTRRLRPDLLDDKN